MNKISQLSSRHSKQIFELELFCSPKPWTLEIIEAEIENRHSLCLGLSSDGRIVSYVLSRVVFDDLQILTIGTHPEHQRKGYGKQLLTFLVKECKSKALTQISLEVRLRNDGARKFYEAFGFKELGIRKGFYEDTGDDALIMAVKL